MLQVHKIFRFCFGLCFSLCRFLRLSCFEICYEKHCKSIVKILKIIVWHSVKFPQMRSIA
ncbi:hypothetical protein CQA40_02025 [Helicobacter sp. MIT 01-3238]|nr:hypothetical protein CQA40_02025 [Helicobacter sp. MIT 01-3238]